MKIEDAIKQKKFTSEFQKAHINILYTSAWMIQQSSSILKPYNISWQQFNLLRILRGMHPEPANIKVLTERMIDKMSNCSRLVEKLKQKGLVERSECPEDRRRVNVVITESGLDLLAEASEELDNHLLSTRQYLTSDEAALLNDLLDKLRGD